MNRRRFLSFSAALAAAGVSLTSGCRIDGADQGRGRGFGAVPAIDPSDPVGSALARAQALGKPLLVFVVPKDVHEQSDRGTLFGSLLNHGDEQVLADLALCEVVCAAEEELQRSLPDADSSACVLLVESTEEPIRARPIAGVVPPIVYEDWETEESEFEASLQARLDVLASWLHEVVAPDATWQARRAEASRSSFGPARLADLEADLEWVRTASSDVDRAAGIVLGFVLEERMSADEARPLLAAAAAQRLRVKPPFGAKWANSTGCGCEIEGEDNEELMTIACGMAFIPELGQRFLSFYV